MSGKSFTELIDEEIKKNAEKSLEVWHAEMVYAGRCFLSGKTKANSQGSSNMSGSNEQDKYELRVKWTQQTVAKPPRTARIELNEEQSEALHQWMLKSQKEHPEWWDGPDHYIGPPDEFGGPFTVAPDTFKEKP